MGLVGASRFQPAVIGIQSFVFRCWWDGVAAGSGVAVDFGVSAAVHCLFGPSNGWLLLWRFCFFLFDSGRFAIGFGSCGAGSGFAIGVRGVGAQSPGSTSAVGRRAAADGSRDGWRRSGFGLHSQVSRGRLPP